MFDDIVMYRVIYVLFKVIYILNILIIIYRRKEKMHI